MSGTAVDLEGAESVLGHVFTDRELGLTALQPWRHGFSRLEFLGDSVLGLAVFTLAEVSRAPRDQATVAVANKELDRTFFRSLSAFTSANTGDVIEASIGAVHLDGGFDAAAGLSARMVELEFGDFDHRVIARHAPELSPKGLRFIGAAMIKAVVADHLCRTAPLENRQWYHESRARLVSTDRIAELSRRHGFASSAVADDAAADQLEIHAATQFVSEGWSVSAVEVASLLEI